DGGGLQLDAIGGIDVPFDGPADEHFAGGDVPLDARPRPENHDRGPPNGALEPAVDSDRPVALDVPDHGEICAEERETVVSAGRGAFGSTLGSLEEGHRESGGVG